MFRSSSVSTEASCDLPPRITFKMTTTTLLIWLIVLFQLSLQGVNENPSYFSSQPGIPSSTKTVYEIVSTTTTCDTSESIGSSSTIGYSSYYLTSSSLLYQTSTMLSATPEKYSSPIVSTYPTSITYSPVETPTKISSVPPITYAQITKCSELGPPTTITVYRTTYVTTQITSPQYKPEPPITITAWSSYITSVTGYQTLVITETLPGSISVQTTTLPPSFVCQAGTTHVTNFNYGNFTTTLECYNKTASTSKSYQCPSFCPYTPSKPCSWFIQTTTLPPIFFPPTTVISTSVLTLNGLCSSCSPTTTIYNSSCSPTASSSSTIGPCTPCSSPPISITASCPANPANITVTSTAPCTTSPILETKPPDCTKTKQRDYLILFILFLILFIISFLLFLAACGFWWRLRHRCRCYVCQNLAYDCTCASGPTFGTGTAAGTAAGYRNGGGESGGGQPPPAPSLAPGPELTAGGGYGTAH